MLLRKQKAQLSAYSNLYDLIVPKDNLHRKISDLIDFTFIYDELVNKYCSNNGRNAESPIRMFKYLLLKTIYPFRMLMLLNVRDMICPSSISLKWLPEDAVINPSSLTKFRGMIAL
jgi:hypothetical protein